MRSWSQPEVSAPLPSGRAGGAAWREARREQVVSAEAESGLRLAAVLKASRALALAVLLVSGGAIVGPAVAEQDENDPLEPVNRAVFQFNYVLDGLILEPAARIYRMVTPHFAREAVSNFLANLRTPVVLANDLLQGQFERGEKTLGRFMLNTIIGVGGLIDVGGHVGMPERHSEDFGQTLAVYGVDPGPYLVLPVLGPSNPRDAIGWVVDFGFDPLFYFAPADIALARFGASALEFRERNLDQIDELKRSSIDLYAATRTLVRQLRANEIRNGATAPIEDIYKEDIYNEDVYKDTQSPGAGGPPGGALEDPETGNAQ
jgi:phospholipid-binding lipoprotein MlaA